MGSRNPRLILLAFYAFHSSFSLERRLGYRNSCGSGIAVVVMDRAERSLKICFLP